MSESYLGARLGARLTPLFLLQILTNAPKAGGSHLPDVTIITPVFDKVSSTSFPAPALSR